MKSYFPQCERNGESGRKKGRQERTEVSKKREKDGEREGRKKGRESGQQMSLSLFYCFGRDPSRFGSKGNEFFQMIGAIPICETI